MVRAARDRVDYESDKNTRSAFRRKSGRQADDFAHEKRKRRFELESEKIHPF
jgi:hypothetical protein